MKALRLPPLTAPKTPNITPSAAGLNRPRVPGRAPRRDEIGAHTVSVLKNGGPQKADLLVVDLGEGPMVVKDFSRKRRWTRLLGRLQISRECRAYGWLGPMPGVPGFLGRVDAHALALERVEGEQLAFAPNRLSDGEALIARLRSLIDRLHAAGVFHQDLRGRGNVLVRSDGELVLVDLAGAICLRPGGWLHRLLRPAFAMSDEAAFLKWKALLTPGRFTREEEEFLRRFRVWRSLWVFNRKRTARSREAS